MTNFTHPEYLVETDWLQQNLSNPNVVTLDCTVHLRVQPSGPYVIEPGRADFEKAHIQGAQFCDVQRDVSDPSGKYNFMRPNAADFAAAMRRFGISNDTRVITYSTANPWWATRVWWLLRSFGHDNAAVLNGGWRKWAKENRPADTGASQPRAAGSFAVQFERDLMADRDEVKAAMGNGAICTLNALMPAQYAGTTYGRPGQIPGSVAVPAGHLLDPATNAFLPADQLRDKLAAVGAMDRPVIAYCGGGIAATADALVLVMLGHSNVKVYDASLSEWSKDESLPMATA
jgi:thiosulfate/3-mercaptopyruvate sulfurtransferase